MAELHAGIAIRGTSYERGFGIGRELRTQISQFLAQSKTARTRCAGSDGPCALKGYPDAYVDEVRSLFPGLWDEIVGISEGAEISVEDVFSLQYSRELNGASLVPECTTIAWAGPTGRCIAQNVDLPAWMGPFGMTQRLAADGGSPEALVFTFPGLLGFCGINAAGIAVGINFVQSSGWGVGVSPYLLVRALLGESSLDDCRKILEKTRTSSSRCFTVVDETGGFFAELTPSQVEFIPIDETLQVHTNHYLSPRLALCDRLNPFHMHSSIDRFDTARALLNESAGNPSEIVAVLSDHSLYPSGICVHPDCDDADDTATVAMVVMNPNDGELGVTYGNPCVGSFKKFRLGAD